MAEGVGELHLAIVVDCSPESLSEDIARGSFGRESPSTRLEALIDVARDYAASSRASAVTVLACDPSKGARVTSEKNVAVVVPPRRVTADDALFRDADRALGLVDDDGRRRADSRTASRRAASRVPRARRHGAPSMRRADPRATRGMDGAPPSPTRRVLVLLASDPDSIAASSLALAPALAKLRAIGARRDVLHVAPPPRHVRASLRRREDARSTTPRGRSVDPRGDASVHLGRRRRVFRACERRVHRSREMFSRGRVDLRGDDDEFGPRRRRRRGRTGSPREYISRDRWTRRSLLTNALGTNALGTNALGTNAPGRTPSARSLRRGLERTVSRATRSRFTRRFSRRNAREGRRDASNRERRRRQARGESTSTSTCSNATTTRRIARGSSAKTASFPRARNRYVVASASRSIRTTSRRRSPR